MAAGKIPQITNLNREATPPPSPPTSQQNAPQCWRHVVRERSLWLATWVGNIPFCFPKRPPSELGSVRPSVKSWLWMTKSTCHPAPSLSALICQVKVYTGSVTESVLKNVTLPTPLPLSPTQMSVRRNHEIIRNIDLTTKCSDVFPVALIKWDLKRNISCKSGTSQMSRCRLSDHKIILGARLSKIKQIIPIQALCRTP